MQFRNLMVIEEDLQQLRVGMRSVNDLSFFRGFLQNLQSFRGKASRLTARRNYVTNAEFKSHHRSHLQEDNLQRSSGHGSGIHFLYLAKGEPMIRGISYNGPVRACEYICRGKQSESSENLWIAFLRSQSTCYLRNKSLK